MKLRYLVAFGIAMMGVGALGTVLAQGGVSQSQSTAHYKFTLDIGPLATMLMPDQAKGAKEGEVMVQVPGGGMPEMTITDQGHPVNHHLELHVYDLKSGQVISDTMPAIVITDASGMSRSLPSVALMYDMQVGPSDAHFGNDVYLADGKYTIAATFKGETATFKDVGVSGAGAGMAMNATPTTPAMSMSMAATPTATGMAATPAPTKGPQTMPMTGGAPFGNFWVVGLSGLLLMGMGGVLYRIGRHRA